MVTPAFGFSVGDFIAVTKLLITLFDSFKESGGAATKYASEKAFLTSLSSTVLRLSHYVQNTPHDDIAREILSLLEIMTEPLSAFRAFLDRHAGALEKLGAAKGLSKTRLTVSFTMKEISGKVEKLKREIEQPIHAVNSLLALQVLRSIENAPKEPLREEQLEQIVEAIRLADIPAELGKQIGVLQRFAAVHGVQNMEHVQRVVEMRETIVTYLDGIHDITKQVQDAVSQNQASLDALRADYQNPRIDTVDQENGTGNHTEELRDMLKEQKDLLIALRSFLEDKIAAQERALQRKDNSGDARDAVSPWPKKTLTTAQLAMVLLSAVVPNVAAATLAMREHHSRGQHRAFLLSNNGLPPQPSSPPSPHTKLQDLRPPTTPQPASVPPRPPNTWPCTSCGTLCPLGAKFCATCIHIGGPKRVVTSWVSEFKPDAQRVLSQDGGTRWVSEFSGQSRFPQKRSTALTSTRGGSRVRDERWSAKLSKLREGGADGGHVSLEEGEKGEKEEKCGWAGSRCTGFVDEGEVGREEGGSSGGDAKASGGVEEESRREDEGKTATTTTTTMTAPQKRTRGATTTSSSSSSSSSPSSSGSRSPSSKETTPSRDKIPNRNYTERYHGGSHSLAYSSGASFQCGSFELTSTFAKAITASSGDRERGGSSKCSGDGLFG